MPLISAANDSSLKSNGSCIRTTQWGDTIRVMVMRYYSNNSVIVITIVIVVRYHNKIPFQIRRSHPIIPRLNEDLDTQKNL